MIIRYPVSIQFYVDRSEKEAFVRACKNGDTNMSREFRRFMREFVRNPPLDDRLYHQPPMITNQS